MTTNSSQLKDPSLNEYVEESIFSAENFYSKSRKRSKKISLGVGFVDLNLPFGDVESQLIEESFFPMVQGEKFLGSIFVIDNRFDTDQPILTLQQSSFQPTGQHHLNDDNFRMAIDPFSGITWFFLKKTQTVVVSVSSLKKLPKNKLKINLLRTSKNFQPWWLSTFLYR